MTALIFKSDKQAGAELKFRELFLIWLAGFVFFALFTPRMFDYLRPPTGDEVFYLITAQSMLQDFDLDETNQFQNKSWLAFYPSCEEYGAPGWKGFSPPGLPCSNNPTIKPEATHTDRPGIYSKHGLGLSALIALPFALGNRVGVMLFMNGVAALLALNIFLLAWEVTSRKKIALLVWLALGFTAPVFSYAYLVFPQLAASLVVIYYYRRSRLETQSRFENIMSSNNLLRLLFMGLCLGLLPWLHNLYLLLAGLLLLYFAAGGRKFKRILPETRREWPRYVFLLVPVLVSYSLYFSYLTWLYGVPLPNAADHDGFSDPLYFLLGFFGLLFDQKYGLLMYNPLYLVPLSMLFKLWRERRNLPAAERSEFYWLLAIFGLYYLVIADYQKWWGQWCPPARYLLPVTPLLAGPLAKGFIALQSRFSLIYIRGAATWAGVIVFAFVADPRLMYNWEDTQPAKPLLWLETNLPFLKNAGLGNFFPGYVNLVEPALPVFWVAHLAWFLLAVWLGRRLIREITVKG